MTSRMGGPATEGRELAERRDLGLASAAGRARLGTPPRSRRARIDELP